MSEKIINIAVSGVDTKQKYEKVCKLTGCEMLLNDDNSWQNLYGIVYYHDNNDGTHFMNDFAAQNYRHCTLYRYEKFVGKFGGKK